MKYFKKFLEFFKELYTPPASKENLYTYRLTLFTVLAGVVALIFAYIQIKMAFFTLEINQKQFNTQLEELNAKAKIGLKVHVVPSAISIGPEITEPIYITIVPRNNGNYNTPTWAANILFCSKIAIKESDSNWTKIDHQMFYYKSNNKILSEQNIFSDKIDSIGNFKIILPGKNYIGEDKIIPIGLFTTYGERAEQTNTLITLVFSSSTWEIKYEPFLVQHGKILTDTKGCFPALK